LYNHVWENSNLWPLLECEYRITMKHLINVREYLKGNKKNGQSKDTGNINKTKTNKAKPQHIMCWTPLCTNKVNKTRALLQTTGGKDEPNIVLCGNHRTRNVRTHNRTTQKTIVKIFVIWILFIHLFNHYLWKFTLIYVNLVIKINAENIAKLLCN
jgi:hypothetical protein